MFPYRNREEALARRNKIKEEARKNFLEAPLSEKARDFLMSRGASVECLEGTTASGKTVIAIMKLFIMISENPRKLHIIAGKTVGDILKNIIYSDMGVETVYPSVQIYPKGNARNPSPHLEFEGKMIYLLGYDNMAKWKSVRGSQLGCILVDEVNLAKIEFVREIITRADYILTTSNPDDPRKPIYKELINRCRPYRKYEADVPKSIMKELLAEPPVIDWKYWFFSFYDNVTMTDEAIAKKKRQSYPGTPQYKHLIEGLRGKATGLCFPNFDTTKNVISKAELKRQIKSGKIKIRNITCGVDLSYSSLSDDNTAFIYQFITEDRKVIIVDEYVVNNKNLNTPLSVSDVARLLFEFLDKNAEEWKEVDYRFARCPAVFVDCADSGTIEEMRKYKKRYGKISDIVESYKKVSILDRINFMISWIYTENYLVCDNCTEHINELQSYSWDEKKVNTPEDGNDHTINASQYGWIPYRDKIGSV